MGKAKEQEASMINAGKTLVQNEAGKVMAHALYPLVNIQKTMENHHFLWVNPLSLWPFSIAMFVYQRVANENGQRDSGFTQL